MNGGQTDACENITLPQTSFVGGKKTLASCAHGKPIFALRTVQSIPNSNGNKMYVQDGDNREFRCNVKTFGDGQNIFDCHFIKLNLLFISVYCCTIFIWDMKKSYLWKELIKNENDVCTYDYVCLRNFKRCSAK